MLRRRGVNLDACAQTCSPLPHAFAILVSMTRFEARHARVVAAPSDGIVSPRCSAGGAKASPSDCRTVVASADDCDRHHGTVVITDLRRPVAPLVAAQSQAVTMHPPWRGRAASPWHRLRESDRVGLGLSGSTVPTVSTHARLERYRYAFRQSTAAWEASMLSLLSRCAAGKAFPLRHLSLV
jgi:hypothetical protein